MVLCEESEPRPRKRIRRLATFALGALIAGLFLLNGCRNRELEKYVASDGRFEVLIPRPLRSEVRKGPAGERIDVLSYERYDGAFGVIYKDAPMPHESEGQVQLMLDAHRTWVFQGERGSITSESRILLQGKWPGRKLEGRLPNSVRFSACLYLVDGRLYQVIALGKPSWFASGDVARFLASFRVS